MKSCLTLKISFTFNLSHPRILKTLCRKITLPEEFDYRQLARLTPGFVGADLMALCREAAMSAVNRILLQPNSADATPPVPQTYTLGLSIFFNFDYSSNLK